MLERINDLFNKPIGYLIIIGTILMFYCTFLNFKKERKPRGYIEVSEIYQKSSVYFFVPVIFFINMVFTILYLYDIKDTDGNSLDGHIIVISLVLFYECLTFIYCNNNKILFNENEIRVYDFFKKVKVYYWEDIVSVKNKKNEVLIIKTTKGNFKIQYSWENVEKFSKILQEKNLVQEDLSKFGKGKAMVSIWKGIKYK